MYVFWDSAHFRQLGYRIGRLFWRSRNGDWQQICLWTSPCLRLLSVYPCLTSQVPLSGFSRLVCLEALCVHTFCQQFQFLLQWDKSEGNFTCRPVAFVCTITRQNEYWSEECLQQYFQRKMEHILRPLHFLCKLYSFEKSKRDLTLRRLMSYIYGAPILDVSRSHTTTQHSR